MLIAEMNVQEDLVQKQSSQSYPLQVWKTAHYMCTVYKLIVCSLTQQCSYACMGYDFGSLKRKNPYALDVEISFNEHIFMEVHVLPDKAKQWNESRVYSLCLTL